MPEDVRRGMTVYRNRDHAFMRLLEKNSAVRKIAVDMHFYETVDGFALCVTDADGFRATAFCQQEKTPAQNPEKVDASLRENLGKLGATDFELKSVTLDIAQPWFVPASSLNAIRRDAIEQLEQIRLSGYQRPARRAPVQPPVLYPLIS